MIQESATSGFGAFDVATGHTKLINYKFRKTEIKGLGVNGHFSSHWCVGSGKEGQQTEGWHSPAEQLRTAE